MAMPYTPPIDNTPTQHDGTEHMAIKNTRIRRLLTRLALWTTAHCYKLDGFVRPISPNLIVKTGPWVHLTEAATMEFISTNTSIPVPRVHCSFVHNNRAYIVMKRIQGSVLAKTWMTLSEIDRETVLAQLRRILKELRSLTPPDIKVRSCVNGTLYDSRIPHARPRFGPFQTIQDFHRWLRDGFRLEDYPDRKGEKDYEDIEAMITKQNGPWPPPVFTHGDLNPCNILLRGTQVVGIIDWEFSGWYPFYWEYTAAWYRNRTREWWQGRLHSFIDAHTEELKMEILRQKWWGDF
ncbi:kinase subdomain-containing protein [Ilyonectria destructans]|nr:kinase subdomain-containing protein [Ilyonectria destructans]